MKNLRKNMVTVITTLLLVLVSAFCISGTVLSQNKGKSQVEAQYYRQMEQDYVKEVRSFLAKQGYGNSGVTMTYVILEDGSREYTILIHHKKISALEETEKQQLLTECGKIEFPAQECRIFHEFLETDL